MAISAKEVMDLRKRTGVGMMDCKKALAQCNGDMDAAIKYLREKGIAKAESKAERDTNEGLVYSYIHSNNKLGVLLEMSCETDFVAKTDDFINLCKDVCMHIAASNPLAVSSEELDQDLLAKEREIYTQKALNEGKPEKIVEKIVDGQISKYIKQNTLLEQDFVKDPDKKVSDLITEVIAKLGENIKISRFVRFALGE